jgi:hypothetical protein
VVESPRIPNVECDAKAYICLIVLWVAGSTGNRKGRGAAADGAYFDSPRRLAGAFDSQLSSTLVSEF